MSSQGFVKRIWFQWKSLKLPWRKRWLVGSDLQGNTYWEFKDTLSSDRFRRIAQYNRRTHYSDIQISPQWHQWLRHTRHDAPSLTEQSSDLQRQSQLKYLAQKADERWASVPSFLDAPKTNPATSQPAPGTVPRDKGGYVASGEPADKQGVRSLVGGIGEIDGQGAARKGLNEEDGKIVREGQAEAEKVEVEKSDAKEEVKTETKEAKTERKNEFRPKNLKENPWAVNRGAAGEDYKPEAWNPNAGVKRR
ncbi:hypothetical protein MMC25_005540 [Agyrium rufum]|nr:hypothetical protein [Agyrium rufum]